MKKLLSLFLVLTILSGLLSGIGFAAEEGREPPENFTIKYDLSRVMYELRMTSSKVNTTTKPADITYDITNDFFRFVTGSYGENWYIGSGANYFYPVTGSADKPDGYNMVLREGKYVTFEVWIPAAGTYQMKVNHGTNAKSADMQVSYKSEKAGESTLLGTYNCALEGASNWTKIGTSTVKTGVSSDGEAARTEATFTVTEPQKYTFTFKVCADGGYRASVSTFSLISGDGNGAVPMGLTLGQLDGGKALGMVLMSDGSTGSLGDIEVTYASLDENIATVDPETGVITDIGNGSVTITATAVIGGRTVTAKGNYNAISSDKLITVKYDLGRALYELGAWHLNVKDITKPIDITYELTSGLFRYTEKSSYGGSFSNDDSNYRLYPYTTTKTDPGSYSILMREGYYMTYEIYVPVAGKYTMRVDNGVAETEGTMQVYYKQGTVSDSYEFKKDAKLLGTYSFAGKEKSLTVTNDVQEESGTVKQPAVFSAPEPGYYTVTFTTQTGAGYRAALGSFYLIAGEENVLMATRLTSSHGQATLDAYMCDGTYEPLFGVEIKFESLNPEIAVIDEATGEVTDLAYGTALLRATCEIDGKEYIAECDYKSYDPNARGVTIDVDITGAISREKLSSDDDATFNQINYDTTNGIFKFFGGSRTANWESNLVAGAKGFVVRHNRYISFEVLIPEPGIYDMEIWPAMNDRIVPINVYVAKGKVSRNKADFVGSYDSINPEVAYNPNYFNSIVPEALTVENIAIHEPGLYVFTFEGDASQYENTGDATWNYRRGSVGRFRLISGGDAALLGGIHGEDVSYIIAQPDENTITYTDPVEKGSTQFNIFTKLLDGTVRDSEYSSVKLKSSEKEIATVDSDGLVHAIGDGDFTISAEVISGGKTYSGSVAMNAYDDTGVSEAILDIPVELYEREKRKTKFTAIMNSGNRAVVPAGVPITYTYEPEGIVKIDSNGTVTGLSKGETTVTATAFFKGEQIEDSVKVSVSLDTGKQEPTYYTYERRESAKENISKYKWARAERDEAVKKAAKYINDDAYLKLYERAPREGLPRARQVTGVADNEYYKYCRYCGADVESANAGGYGAWGKDPINRPWKLQCTHCKRLFPSNDFELLYERGLDENGVYNVDLARENNAIAVENGEKDALVNELYPEIGSQRTPENGGEPGTVVTLNNGRGLRPGETVEGWGVDDGWGYRPKDENGKNYTIAGGDIEIHCYIASYTWQFWNVYEAAMAALSDAYLYTGDEKYGRAGAILLDRYADLFPEYDLSIQNKKDGARLNSAGHGCIRNPITDSESLAGVALRTDALYPMTADSQVISFLSQKAEELGLENKKSSRREIWENWKNGILLAGFERVKDRRLGGNFGMYQRLIASAAVSLAEEPESTEMVEWIYAAGSTSASTVKGGNVLAQLVNDVDRDGMGDESGDNYNTIWLARLFQVSEILNYYKGDANYNLFEHPKFMQMFTPYLKKVLVNNQLAQIGDSGSPGSLGISGNTDAYLAAFKIYEGTELGDLVAQHLYMQKKGKFDDLHYDIFTRDPESIQETLRQVATENFNQKSDLMAGYGFGILRDGGSYSASSGTTEVNNLRDAWMYFGTAGSHAHHDNLNLGLEAFGLNIAPDNGYPERTGTDAMRLQWHTSTIAHNTVTIDGVMSEKSLSTHCFPLHFDDTEQVKVLDVDAKVSYENAENYRRTLVMVKVNDDISYTMDFFRVTGGTEHIYSFHSQAENAVTVQGLEMTEQKDENGNWIGTYASGYDAEGNLVKGVNVPYKDRSGSYVDSKGNPYLFTGPGQDPWTKDLWNYDTYFPRGFTWMRKVRRDETPANEFAVEFEVEDYRKTIKNGKGIRLRLTQLNGFTPDEVAIVGGLVPRKETAAALPETFDYLLVTHKGENLDSLFTTVLEPYRNTRYLERIEPCEVAGVSADDTTVRAVKVTHTGGERVDYIVYAEDNSKTYRIDNLFDFQGFVGVYSVNKNGEVLNRYVNDGTVIGDETDGSVLGADSTKPGAYTGVISGFDGEMNFGDFENYIDVEIRNAEIDDAVLADITGRWIYISNDGKRNAAYEIFGAEKLSDKVVRLDTGNVTNIRSYVDSYDPDEGYIYNMEIGNAFTIPMSYSDDSAPEFEPIRDSISTSAESTVSVKVSASSPLEGKTVTYEATTLPRGASLNSETGVFTWKPDDSQVGQNHVAITAVDSDGRQSTIHFDVTVYGKTTGSSSSNKEENNTPSDNSGTAGGGGGGGGAAPIDTPDDETKTDETDTSDKTDDESLPLEEKVPSEGEADEVEKTQFTDLGNHAWAEDSINALANTGIIKGTSASTFSPVNNITRADFALLLVRAFKLTSDNTENFADVSANDYFATELAIARNTGIVNGIGDNKYAPRSTITRQDMMVIVYRALQSLLLEEKGDRRMAVDEVLSKYPDFDTVADYARDAVTNLIGAELVNGKSGRIAPTDYTTRAEVAVLIKRILEYTKKQI
ncbi:MAG: hypothetical protein E7441_04770 [Ruminococcaceae bacterium]|nr:hypothetical protein [Oscillospiraceae bacterium]